MILLTVWCSAVWDSGQKRTGENAIPRDYRLLEIAINAKRLQLHFSRLEALLTRLNISDIVRIKKKIRIFFKTNKQTRYCVLTHRSAINLT